MLSHHERQELARIQHSLEHDDPALADALGRLTRPRGSLSSRAGRVAADVLAAGIIVLGVVTLNFGLLFLGALILAVAACLHVTSL